jgi:predicted anti-sigma-YlaC factor YlaD
MTRKLPSPRGCDQIRECISRALDDELSELDRARLETHLESCGACRAFQAETAKITQTLRASALEQPTFGVILPRRRRAPLRVLQVGTAAAALALIAALSTIHGLGQRESGGLSLAPNMGIDNSDVVVPIRHPRSTHQIYRYRSAF